MRNKEEFDWSQYEAPTDYKEKIAKQPDYWNEHEVPEKQSSSALSTLGKHAFNVPIAAVHSAMEALGMNPVPLEKAVHPSFQTKPEDYNEHPIASRVGDIAPLLALRGLKIPSDIAKLYSFLRRPKQQTENVEQQQQDLGDYQTELYKQYGMRKPEQFGKSIFEANKKIGELTPEAEAPVEPTENLLPHTGEVKAAETGKGLSDILKETKEYLMPGQEHDVMVQEYLKSRPQELQNYASKEFYKPATKMLEGIEIKQPSPEINKALEDYLGKGYETDPKNQKIIESYLAANKDNTKSISLSSVYDNFRSVKDELYRARSLSFQENIPEAARQAAKAKVKDLEPVFEKLESLMDKYAPEESKELLAKGKDFYGKNIAPLYETKLYWEAQKGRGLSSKDLMAAMRGQGKGQQLIRKLMSENPNMLRALLGQRYSQNPEKLIGELSSREEKYIDQLPSLKGMRERLRAAHEANLNAQKDAAYLKKNMEGLVKEWEGIKNTQARNERARRDIDKLHNEIEEMQKAHDELIKREENLAEATKLQEKIQTRKRIMKWLIGTAATYAGYSGAKSIFKYLL